MRQMLPLIVQKCPSLEEHQVGIFSMFREIIRLTTCGLYSVVNILFDKKGFCDLKDVLRCHALVKEFHMGISERP